MPPSGSLSDIIDATSAAVRSDVSNAAVVFRASGSNTAGVATLIRSGQHTFTVDEPPALGGEDTAANPVEVALASLAACQVVTYRFWAARLGIAVDGIDVDAEGDLDVRGFFGLDDSVRSGFGEVRLTVTLTGPESEDRYAELRAAVDAHCPVLDLFGNRTPVSTSLRIATASK
jgi:uncharacterized OsmC-like protein